GNQVTASVNPNGVAPGSIQLTIYATIPDNSAGDNVRNTATILESNHQGTSEFSILSEPPEREPATLLPPTPNPSVCDDFGIPSAPGINLPQDGNGLSYSILTDPLVPGKTAIVQAEINDPGYIMPEDLPDGWT